MENSNHSNHSKTEPPEESTMPAMGDSPSEEGLEEEVVEVSSSQKVPNKGKKKKRNSVHPWKLFRFADGWDIMMITVGFITAVISGLALPGHVILFGEIINDFVYYSAVTDVPDGDADMFMGESLSLAAEVEMFADSNNMTCEEVQSNVSLVMMIIGERNSSLLCADNQDPDIFLNTIEYLCNPRSELMTSIGIFSAYYVIVATGVLAMLFVATVFWNASAYRQTRRMRHAFYRSILHQEIGWFDVTEASELSTRLADDVEKIQAGIGDKVSLFLNYFTTFVAGFIIAFVYSWKMALVVLCILPLLTFTAAAIAKIVATFTAREQSAYAAAGAVAEEVLSSIRTVVAFGGEKREVGRYNVQLVEARKEGIKKAFFSSLVGGLLFFFIFAIQALAFWFGSTLVTDCEISAGDVVTVFLAVLLGSFYLGNALPELETFGVALGSASVIFEVIDRKPVIDASAEKGEVPMKMEGNIRFSDVVFHYPARPSVQVLKGLDLEVQHGQTVALVGASGCGKSTVIQLIQRFYNPDGGKITVDGRDISSLNIKWLRSQLGVVSQEPVLFDTTIEENIRNGRDDATLEDIQEAARAANAHDFIMKLPQGYSTDVGERGAQLSGGQKQRIAIARALIRDPKLLLLDEATSALDTESEKVVQEALDNARKGRTTIVIAHRLSTIQNADIIISIEDGRVVEMGTHAELMKKNGVYYELVTAQTIAEEEEKQDKNNKGLAGFKAALKRSLSSRSKSSLAPYDDRVSGRKAAVQRSQSWKDPSTRSANKRATVKRTSSWRDYAFTPGINWLLFAESQHSLSREPSHLSLSREPSHPDITHSPSFSATNPITDEAVTGEEAVENDNEVEEAANDSVGTSQRPTVRRRIRRREKISADTAEPVEDASFMKLMKLNIPDWPLVLLGVLFNAVVGALFPLMAIFFSEALMIYGLQTVEEIEDGILPVTGGFIALAVFSFLTNFFASFTLSVAGERLTKRLRFKTFEAMLRQEIGWFDLKTHSTGVLTTRLATDAAEVKGATGIRLGIALQVLAGLVAVLIISFSASWELSFVMILIIPTIGTVAYVQTRLAAGSTKKNKQRLEESGQTAVESIDNIRTVVGLGLEDKFFKRYSSLLVGPFRDNIKSVFLLALIVSLSQSVLFYLYAAGFSLGAFLVVEDRAEYDDIFRVFGAIVFTAFSLGRAVSFASDASKAKVSAARIFSLLSRRPLIDVSDEEGQKMETSTGNIAVSSVHFTYPARPDVKVLQGINLSVKPGKTLALVGPSGCGKSTVISLVERFYDPVRGSLTLEGVDLRDWNLQCLRTQIGIVSQEPVLFDASIAENISYGALFREVTADEVVEAAKSANIHNFINSLPEGYDTNVGAKGTQLSGGQKQRIAIARALIRDPKVLLLDEATSALDTESEKVVQEALDKAREGRTTIVIAHRLSTIYNSDVIAVIHNGEVIESGTHSELMATRGAYYLLNTVQAQEEEN